MGDYTVYGNVSKAICNCVVRAIWDTYILKPIGYAVAYCSDTICRYFNLTDYTTL